MMTAFRASLALAFAAAAFSAAAAIAADDIVKPAVTPAPSAGPTIAAAQAFCGDASGKADELFQRYSTSADLKQVYKSSDFIAFSDDEKNATRMYTFTVAGHAAHPTAVCRKIVKEGDAAVIRMEVVCDGEKGACDKIKNDFNVMLAKMQVEVDQQIAAEKK